MKNIIWILSLLLVVLVLVTACSKPKAPDSSGSTGAVPSPVISPPAEPAEPAPAESPKAAPPPKPPVKTPAKTTPKPASAENAAPVAPAPEVVITPPPSAPPAVVQAPVPEKPPAVVAPAVRHVTLPANTMIAVRMIDSVDSRTDRAGQTFRASIDSDVIVGDEAVVRRGEDAFLKLMLVTSAGELRGKSELQLQLERIVVGKKSYNVDTNVVVRSAEAEGPKTARDIGIGAAIGAAIGAIAGGGKGAAIGAGAGAGAGAATAAITKGEQVLVPSETRLEFRLEEELEIELQPAAASPVRETYSSSGPRRLGEYLPAVTSRKPDAPDDSKLSGEWRLYVEGPRRAGTFTMFLEQDGNRLRGRITAVSGRPTILWGNVDGRSVTFITESRVRNRTVESKYTGRISANGLRGTMTMCVAGALRNEWRVDWTAERIRSYVREEEP